MLSMMGLTPRTTMHLPLGGKNIIPLGKFSGKKECGPKFIQTFKAVVDKQPCESILKLAILEQHIIGQAKDCIKGFPFDEKSYPFVDDFSLQIFTSCGTSFFSNAYVVNKNSHQVPYLNVNSLKERCKHLEHAVVQLLDGPIDLLIGQDIPSLFRQLEVRYGEKDKPYAVRTPLGWSICGPLGTSDASQSIYVLCTHEDESTNVDYILRTFWEIETIANDIPTSRKKLIEVQEQTQKTTIHVGNRYQV